MNMWAIKEDEPIYKTQLIYANFIVNLTIKPNLLMRLFLKLLGIKIKILDRSDEE